jgi:chromosome partitioning protein
LISDCIYISLRVYNHCLPRNIEPIPLLQTVDLLQELESDRYRILLTMVHPKPVKMAEQARLALSDVPLFDTEIRRLIAYEKAALMGVPVYEVKDRMAKIAWSDYEQVGKEIMS